MRFLVMHFGYESQADQDAMRVLRVRGRKSGRLYDVPVRIATMNGRRYFMSMLGDAPWVGNVRRADTVELIANRAAETFRVHEIEGEERISFWDWYCRHPQYAARARSALSADVEHLSLAELERLGHMYPVFRLEPILLAYGS